MAGPEIELATHSLPLSQRSIDEKNLSSLHNDDSTRHNSDMSQKEMLSDLASFKENRKSTPASTRQLEYLYLTFETELPNPAINALPQQSIDSLRTPPDLSQYANPFEWSSSRKS